MNLILTLDYEIFGDGSGDIFRHMVTPTSEILKICEKYNIKTTIFFEVVEYWAFKKECKIGNFFGYDSNPIEAIEAQIREAYANGHDIQLHFHPQWVKASYKNDKWILNFDNWRLGDFKVVEEYNTQFLLKEGKKTLKKIIKPIDSNYSPQIIRAGGYNIMPSKSIIEAMKNADIKVDSSVYPGGYENGKFSKYDFRKVPFNKDYWYTDNNDLTIESLQKSDQLEIPIFSLIQPRWKKLGKERLKSIFLNKKSAINSFKNKNKKRSFLQKTSYWFEKEAQTWDFCLFSPRMHNQFFNHIHIHLRGIRNTFVLVGHPKTFSSRKSFEYLIEKAKENNFKFLTLNEYFKIL